MMKVEKFPNPTDSNIQKIKYLIKLATEYENSVIAKIDNVELLVCPRHNEQMLLSYLNNKIKKNSKKLPSNANT